MAKRPTDALVIAIDGPSGSGKSTVARGVARRLGLRYLDTGAMYRAVTWLVLDLGVDPADAGDVEALAEAADLVVSDDPDDPRIAVAGRDVTVEVRSEPVTAAVSAVSAVPAVRSAMVRRQRSIIGDGGVVVEGRDIGTTVAPAAPVKIFLTARADVRASRRGLEIAGPDLDDRTLSATQDALARRDAADSGRTTSPLTQAADAVVIDSTSLSADEVVDRVVGLARAVVTA